MWILLPLAPSSWPKSCGGFSIRSSILRSECGIFEKDSVIGFIRCASRKIGFWSIFGRWTLPPHQRVKKVLVVSPPELVANKVTSMVSRGNKPKGIMDRADLARVLLTFPELKQEE